MLFLYSLHLYLQLCICLNQGQKITIKSDCDRILTCNYLTGICWYIISAIAACTIYIMDIFPNIQQQIDCIFNTAFACILFHVQFVSYSMYYTASKLYWNIAACLIFNVVFPRKMLITKYTIFVSISRKSIVWYFIYFVGC